MLKVLDVQCAFCFCHLFVQHPMVCLPIPSHLRHSSGQASLSVSGSQQVLKSWAACWSVLPNMGSNYHTCSKICEYVGAYLFKRLRATAGQGPNHGGRGGGRRCSGSCRDQDWLVRLSWLFLLLLVLLLLSLLLLWLLLELPSLLLLVLLLVLLVLLSLLWLLSCCSDCSGDR